MSMGYTGTLLLPRARMREAGLSNGFCPSVCQSSLVPRPTLKSGSGNETSVSQSSKFWADHDNEGSKHF